MAESKFNFLNQNTTNNIQPNSADIFSEDATRARLFSFANADNVEDAMHNSFELSKNYLAEDNKTEESVENDVFKPTSSIDGDVIEKEINNSPKYWDNLSEEEKEAYRKTCKEYYKAQDAYVEEMFTEDFFKELYDQQITSQLCGQYGVDSEVQEDLKKRIQDQIYTNALYKSLDHYKQGAGYNLPQDVNTLLQGWELMNLDCKKEVLQSLQRGSEKQKYASEARHLYDQLKEAQKNRTKKDAKKEQTELAFKLDALYAKWVSSEGWYSADEMDADLEMFKECKALTHSYLRNQELENASWGTVEQSIDKRGHEDMVIDTKTAECKENMINLINESQKEYAEREENVYKVNQIMQQIYSSNSPEEIRRKYFEILKQEKSSMRAYFDENGNSIANETKDIDLYEMTKKIAQSAYYAYKLGQDRAALMNSVLDNEYLADHEGQWNHFMKQGKALAISTVTSGVNKFNGLRMISAGARDLMFGDTEVYQDEDMNIIDSDMVQFDSDNNPYYVDKEGNKKAVKTVKMSRTTLQTLGKGSEGEDLWMSSQQMTDMETYNVWFKSSIDKAKEIGSNSVALYKAGDDQSFYMDVAFEIVGGLTSEATDLILTFASMGGAAAGARLLKGASTLGRTVNKISHAGAVVKGLNAVKLAQPYVSNGLDAIENATDISRNLFQENLNEAYQALDNDILQEARAHVTQMIQNDPELQKQLADAIAAGITNSLNKGEVSVDGKHDEDVVNAKKQFVDKLVADYIDNYKKTDDYRKRYNKTTDIVASTTIQNSMVLGAKNFIMGAVTCARIQFGSKGVIDDATEESLKLLQIDKKTRRLKLGDFWTKSDPNMSTKAFLGQKAKAWGKIITKQSVNEFIQGDVDTALGDAGSVLTKSAVDHYLNGDLSADSAATLIRNFDDFVSYVQTFAQSTVSEDAINEGLSGVVAKFIPVGFNADRTISYIKHRYEQSVAAAEAAKNGKSFTPTSYFDQYESILHPGEKMSRMEKLLMMSNNEFYNEVFSQKEGHDQVKKRVEQFNKMLDNYDTVVQGNLNMAALENLLNGSLDPEDENTAKLITMVEALHSLNNPIDEIDKKMHEVFGTDLYAEDMWTKPDYVKTCTDEQREELLKSYYDVHTDKTRNTEEDKKALEEIGKNLDKFYQVSETYNKARQDLSNYEKKIPGGLPQELRGEILRSATLSPLLNQRVEDLRKTIADKGFTIKQDNESQETEMFSSSVLSKSEHFRDYMLDKMKLQRRSCVSQIAEQRKQIKNLEATKKQLLKDQKTAIDTIAKKGKQATESDNKKIQQYRADIDKKDADIKLAEKSIQDITEMQKMHQKEIDRINKIGKEAKKKSNDAPLTKEDLSNMGETGLAQLFSLSDDVLENCFNADDLRFIKQMRSELKDVVVALAKTNLRKKRIDRGLADMKESPMLAYYKMTLKDIQAFKGAYWLNSIHAIDKMVDNYKVTKAKLHQKFWESSSDWETYGDALTRLSVIKQFLSDFLTGDVDSSIKFFPDMQRMILDLYNSKALQENKDDDDNVRKDKQAKKEVLAALFYKLQELVSVKDIFESYSNLPEDKQKKLKLLKLLKEDSTYATMFATVDLDPKTQGTDKQIMKVLKEIATSMQDGDAKEILNDLIAGHEKIKGVEQATNNRSNPNESANESANEVSQSSRVDEDGDKDDQNNNAQQDQENTPKKPEDGNGQTPEPKEENSPEEGDGNPPEPKQGQSQNSDDNKENQNKNQNTPEPQSENQQATENVLSEPTVNEILKGKEVVEEDNMLIISSKKLQKVEEVSENGLPKDSDTMLGNTCFGYKTDTTGKVPRGTEVQDSIGDSYNKWQESKGFNIQDVIDKVLPLVLNSSNPDVRCMYSTDVYDDYAENKHNERPLLVIPYSEDVQKAYERVYGSADDTNVGVIEAYENGQSKKFLVIGLLGYDNDNVQQTTFNKVRDSNHKDIVSKQRGDLRDSAANIVITGDAYIITDIGLTTGKVEKSSDINDVNKLFESKESNPMGINKKDVSIGYYDDEGNVVIIGKTKNSPSLLMGFKLKSKQSEKSGNYVLLTPNGKGMSKIFIEPPTLDHLDLSQENNGYINSLKKVITDVLADISNASLNDPEVLKSAKATLQKYFFCKGDVTVSITNMGLVIKQGDTTDIIKPNTPNPLEVLAKFPIRLTINKDIDIVGMISSGVIRSDAANLCTFNKTFAVKSKNGKSNHKRDQKSGSSKRKQRQNNRIFCNGKYYEKTDDGYKDNSGNAVDDATKNLIDFQLLMTDTNQKEAVQINDTNYRTVYEYKGKLYIWDGAKAFIAEDSLVQAVRSYQKGQSLQQQINDNPPESTPTPSEPEKDNLSNSQEFQGAQGGVGSQPTSSVDNVGNTTVMDKLKANSERIQSRRTSQKERRVPNNTVAVTSVKNLYEKELPITTTDSQGNSSPMSFDQTPLATVTSFRGNVMDMILRDFFANKITQEQIDAGLDSFYPNIDNDSIKNFLNTLKVENDNKTSLLYGLLNNDDYEIITSEFWLSTYIPVDKNGEILWLPVEGKPDLIARNKKTGKFVVIDFKTKTSNGLSHDDEVHYNRQLSLYCKAIEDAGGTIEKSGLLIATVDLNTNFSASDYDKSSPYIDRNNEYQEYKDTTTKTKNAVKKTRDAQGVETCMKVFANQKFTNSKKENPVHYNFRKATEEEKQRNPELSWVMVEDHDSNGTDVKLQCGRLATVKDRKTLRAFNDEVLNFDNLSSNYQKMLTTTLPQTNKSKTFDEKEFLKALKENNCIVTLSGDFTKAIAKSVCYFNSIGQPLNPHTVEDMSLILKALLDLQSNHDILSDLQRSNIPNSFIQSLTDYGFDSAGIQKILNNLKNTVSNLDGVSLNIDTSGDNSVTNTLSSYFTIISKMYPQSFVTSKNNSLEVTIDDTTITINIVNNQVTITSNPQNASMETKIRDKLGLNGSSSTKTEKIDTEESNYSKYISMAKKHESLVKSRVKGLMPLLKNNTWFKDLPLNDLDKCYYILGVAIHDCVDDATKVKATLTNLNKKHITEIVDRIKNGCAGQ